ncbi:MAG: hypothetical protein ACQESR_06545 [Planctomycetota bacterium]
MNACPRPVAWWQRTWVREAAAGVRARHFRSRYCGVPVVVIAWLTSTCFGPSVDAAEIPFVATQVPRRAASDEPARLASPLSPCPAERGRIVRVSTDGTLSVLTKGFHSAADPEISFDATRMLFAGKRTATDKWNIYEMEFETGEVRRITHGSGNCRQPGYQSTLFTIVSTEPWYQLTFVSDMAGKMNENGSGVARSLYSCKLDGSQTRRLTYNLSDDADPFLMRDGRLLYAGWQRGTLRRGGKGRVGLFGVNIDGTDNALFADTSGRLVKRMPCVTDQGLVLFVESGFGGDGSGQLSAVSFRRPLHGYRPVTSPSDGYLYRYPSPWPGGHVIVSRRPRADASGYGIVLFHPKTGRAKKLLDTAEYDEVQAMAVRARRESDGRSSVVDEGTPYGKLYCLNVNVNDFSDRAWHPPGTARRVRLLEGVAVDASDSDCYLEPLPGTSRRPGSTCNGLPPLVQRRILGEVDIKSDGSFNVKIPANTPVQLQTVDKNGVALRSCDWVWAKNKEPRGCIGCHEDGELTPENTFVDSMKRSSIPLMLPAERRRTVDFRRDIMPIVEQKCVGCHDSSGAPPRLDGGLKPVSQGDQAHFNRAYLNLLAERPTAGSDSASNRGAPESGPRRYITPGEARTSPLIWHLFGRNLARPWDGNAAEQQATPIPNDGSDVEPLSELERRRFVEWVDMGALWDGIPGEDELEENGRLEY